MTQIRSEETDGYTATQLAFDDMSEKKTIKSAKGHFEKAGTTGKAQSC